MRDRRKPRKIHTANPLNTPAPSKNFTVNPFAINGLQTYVMPNRCDSASQHSRR
jgi:hypothetical protein